MPTDATRTNTTGTWDVSPTAAKIPSIGDRLPGGRLRAVDGSAVALRSSASRAVIVLAPHPGCTACDDYARTVDDARAQLSRWSATAIVFVTDAEEGERMSRLVDLPVVVAADLRDRWDQDGTAAVLVADSHGEIWDRAVAGGHDLRGSTGHHDFPDVDEMAEDVKFIAIQCPECDVLDIPGLGEWDPAAPAKG